MIRPTGMGPRPAANAFPRFGRFDPDESTWQPPKPPTPEELDEFRRQQQERGGPEVGIIPAVPERGPAAPPTTTIKQSPPGTGDTSSDSGPSTYVKIGGRLIEVPFVPLPRKDRLN